MKSRVHLRVDQVLLAKARKLSTKRHMTLTALVEQTLRFVIEAAESEERMRKMPQDAEQI